MAANGRIFIASTKHFLSFGVCESYKLFKKLCNTFYFLIHELCLINESISKLIIMKKLSLIITSLTCLLMSNSIEAQDNSGSASSFHKVELGFRLMPTLSAITMESSSGGTVKGEGTIGFGFGGFLGFNFTKHVGFAAEMLYNTVSQRFKDNGFDRELKVKYVTIPLLMSLNTGVGNPINLKVELGPQIGLNIGSSVKLHGDTLQTVLSTKQTGLGIAYGSGLGIMLNTKKTTRFDIGYRGVYGSKIKTNAIYLGFALLF